MMFLSMNLLMLLEVLGPFEWLLAYFADVWLKGCVHCTLSENLREGRVRMGT